MTLPPFAVRLARAAVFGLLCVTMTALGHSLASGGTLSLGLIAVSTVATTAAAWPLTARRRGPVTVLGATLTAQALLHTFFMAAQMKAPTLPLGAGLNSHHTSPFVDGPLAAALPPGPAGHLDLAARQLDQAAGHLGLAAGHETSLGMLAAHLLAALICGLWLWRGETAAFRLLGAVAAVLFAPLARVGRILTQPSGQGPVGATLPIEVPCRIAQRVFLRHALSRRGPPRQIAFC